MNNFYASVELMLHPELRGKPLAVCGDEEERHGIVLAKNYLAAESGIKTGETVWSAKKKCSELVTVKPHFEEYMRFSELARDIYRRYTDKVEPFGLDECWLDVSNSAKNTEDGVVIAERIRNRIKAELGVTISVGVSFNKVFAKLGSDIKKPDAVTVIPKNGFISIIGELPASSLLGVGGKTEKILKTYCIDTISELADFSKNMLIKLLGKSGEMLWNYANGLDFSPVVARNIDALDKSVGNGVTARYDLETADDVWCLMLELSQELGHRLSVFEKKATSVAIQIKDNEMNVKQWQCALDTGTQSAYCIAKKAFELFSINYKWVRPVRAVSVRAINLISVNAPVQIDMFSGYNEMCERKDISKVIENIRSRFGSDSIKNAVVPQKAFKNQSASLWRMVK